MTPAKAPAATSGFVDLRSDTVTRPTPEMRRAMAEAEVGDDGYRDDPTVNALEEAYAQRVGKPAAMYVPSGTMANQVALRVLCPPGRLAIAGRRQHVVIYEAAATAANAGIQVHAVDDTDGTISVPDIAWAIEAASHSHPEPGIVCVEHTHMPSGGTPWSLDALEAVVAAATAGSLPVHMDGARLFNAEVATGVDAARFAAPVTTVMSCLSKGLCAPVGSLLAGPADVMEAARVERLRLGGSMRQAGVIAAAGLVALRTMVDRLAEDHARARRLAQAVADRWPDAGCDPGRVPTNMVIFGHGSPQRVVDHLRHEGVLGGTIAPGVLRLVTHHDVDDPGLERAVKALASAP
jgi:threonine aldolase